jgi:hypothetical protein
VGQRVEWSGSLSTGIQKELKTCDVLPDVCYVFRRTELHADVGGTDCSLIF